MIGSGISHSRAMAACRSTARLFTAQKCLDRRMAIGETEVIRRTGRIEGGKSMGRALGLIMLSGFLVLGATASWATGMNPFGPSGMPLTAKDFAAMAAVADPLMEDETIPIGTTKSWSNPVSGNQGTITLEGRFTFHFPGRKQPCRKLRY